MKAWDQFLRDLLPLAPGCPEPVAEHALLRAAQQFLRGTRLWTIALQPTLTIPNVVEYDIELEMNTELVRLETATLDGRPIDVTTEGTVRPDWRDWPTSMMPCVFTEDQKTLIVLPRSDQAHTVAIKASLAPSNSAVGVEDFIYDQHVLKIAKGAAGMVLQQAGKPYTNPAQGMLLEKQFQNDINATALRRWRGFSSALPRRRLQNF